MTYNCKLFVLDKNTLYTTVKYLYYELFLEVIVLL